MTNISSLSLVSHTRHWSSFYKSLILNECAGAQSSFMGALLPFSAYVGVRVPLTQIYADYKTRRGAIYRAQPNKPRQFCRRQCLGAINRAPTNDRKHLIPVHALFKSKLTIAQVTEAGKTSAGWRLASCRQQIANPQRQHRCWGSRSAHPNLPR